MKISFLNQKKYFFVVSFVFALTLACFTHLFFKGFSQSAQTLWNSDSSVQIEVFGDPERGGNSYFENWRVLPEGLLLEFKLQNKYTWPYLGVRFRTFNAQGQLDCKSLSLGDSLVFYFDFLDRKIIPNQVAFQLVTSDQNSINSKKWDEHRLLLQKNEVLNKSRQAVAVAQFKMPDWFIAENRIQNRDDLRYLNHTCNIEMVFTHSLLSLDQDYKIRLQKIELIQKSEPNFFALGLILALGLISLLGVVWMGFIKTKSSPKQNLDKEDKVAQSISIQDMTPVAIKQLKTDPWPLIQEYVLKSYSQSELSTENVAEHFKMSPRELSALIKQKLNTQFRDWLAQIRLKESARLLRESDEQIMQIAFLVGFNTSNHFNRKFKEHFGCSPSEYREQFKSSSS